MVTVAQLRGERRRAFRAVRVALRKAQTAIHRAYREVDRRLDYHARELLDTQDAAKIVEVSQAADAVWQEYKSAILRNLQVFFT